MRIFLVAFWWLTPEWLWKHLTGGSQLPLGSCHWGFPKCASDQSWKDNPALERGEGNTSISTMNYKLNRKLFWYPKRTYSNPIDCMSQSVNSYTSIFYIQNSYHTLRLDFSVDSNFFVNLGLLQKVLKTFALTDMIKICRFSMEENIIYSHI